MRYLLPCAFVITLGLSSCGDEINIFPVENNTADQFYSSEYEMQQAVVYNPQNEMFSHFGMKRYNFKNETQLFKVIPHTSKNQKNRPASPERNTFEGS